MHALHEETNAKLRANIFAKNDVLEGVGVEMVRVQREVGVKCGCVQVCFVGERPGVRSWRTMVQVQVAVSKKTETAMPRNINRFRRRVRVREHGGGFFQNCRGGYGEGEW